MCLRFEFELLSNNVAMEFWTGSKYIRLLERLARSLAIEMSNKQSFPFQKPLSCTGSICDYLMQRYSKEINDNTGNDKNTNWESRKIFSIFHIRIHNFSLELMIQKWVHSPEKTIIYKKIDQSIYFSIRRDSELVWNSLNVITNIEKMKRLHMNN